MELIVRHSVFKAELARQHISHRYVPGEPETIKWLETKSITPEEYAAMYEEVRTSRLY